LGPTPEQLRKEIANELEKRLGDKAFQESLASKARETASEAAQKAIEEARPALREEIASAVKEGLQESVVSKALEGVNVEVDVAPIQEEVARRATEAAVKAVEARLFRVDLDAIVERIAGEAGAKALAVAREGLVPIVEKLTERVLKEATAAALPRVAEKLDVAAIEAAIQKEAAVRAAQDLLAKANLAPATAELAAIPERLAHDALARATVAIDERIRTVDLQGLEARLLARMAEIQAHAPAVHVKPTPPVDVDAIIAKAADAATKKALAALAEVEKKIPAAVDVNALKADLYRLVKAELPSGSGTTPGSGVFPITDAHFKALAREVKAMKESLGQLLMDRGGGESS
jgi:hypothetical protein